MKFGNFISEDFETKLGTINPNYPENSFITIPIVYCLIDYDNYYGILMQYSINPNLESSFQKGIK